MPVTYRTREFLDKVKTRVYAAMDATADLSVTTIKAEIGIQYPPASTPGNPPHRRTGNLQNGVQQITMENENSVTSHIGSARVEGNPRVPSYLEFGTKRMAARPYMSPEFATAPPKFKRAVVAALLPLTSK